MCHEDETSFKGAFGATLQGSRRETILPQNARLHAQVCRVLQKSLIDRGDGAEDTDFSTNTSPIWNSCKMVNSGPVVCMVWEGKEAVTTGRKMLGATNPLESAPGTIRGDFCIEVSLSLATLSVDMFHSQCICSDKL
jgi:nucleoside diphosphate kinase